MRCPDEGRLGGNKKADELARMGAETGWVHPELFSGLAVNTVRAEMERDQKRKISEQWKRLPRLSEAHIILGSITIEDLKTA